MQNKKIILFGRKDFSAPYGETLERYIKRNLQLIKDNSLLYVLPEEGELQPDFQSKILKKLPIEFIFGTYRSASTHHKLKVTHWPNYFLYDTFYFRNCDIVDTVSNEVNSTFTLLNGRPRSHRGNLMDMLAKYNLLEDNYYTWHQMCDHNFKYWKQEIKKLDGEFVHKNQYSYPRQMYQSLIELITETSTDIPFITEKTYRAIVFKKPFIVLGYPGIHRYLESIGYKLPRDVIDYSFDDQPDVNLRIDMIARELKRLSSLNLAELNDKMKNTVDYNYNLAKQHVTDKFGIPEVVLNFDYYKDLVDDAIKKVVENKKHKW
jgi:hypothetical protein